MRSSEITTYVDLMTTEETQTNSVIKQHQPPLKTKKKQQNKKLQLLIKLTTHAKLTLVLKVSVCVRGVCSHESYVVLASYCGYFKAEVSRNKINGDFYEQKIFNGKLSSYVSAFKVSCCLASV